MREELARILLRDAGDPRFGLMSITDVRISRDLSVADVYVSSLSAATGAERADLVDTLRNAKGFIRSQIARRNGMRKTPSLRFHYDDLPESGARLEALIDEAVATPRMNAVRSGDE